jgi:hypothetical protein
MAAQGAQNLRQAWIPFQRTLRARVRKAAQPGTHVRAVLDRVEAASHAGQPQGVDVLGKQ